MIRALTDRGTRLSGVGRPGLDGTCWPTRPGDDLLRAALLPTGSATEAWRRVRPVLDLNGDLQREIPRLLPMVLTTVDAAALGSDAGVMKRRHREAWRDNQLHLHWAHRWLDQLVGQVPIMLLKGLPLALTVYPDIGRRPMNDVDVLVGTRHIDRAVALLLANGWEPAEARAVPRSWKARHSLPLLHPDGGHVDLHHQPGVPFMGVHGGSDAATDFFSSRHTVSIGGNDVAIPTPEHQLAHAIVHGLTSVPGSSTRWVVDATLIMRQPNVDWDRFVSIARRYRIIQPIRSALRYVVDTVDAPVPAEVLRALWAEPVTAGDRRRFEALTATPDTTTRAGNLAVVKARWARLRTALGPAASFGAAPRFAADLLHVDNEWAVPRELARRIVRGRR